MPGRYGFRSGTGGAPNDSTDPNDPGNYNFPGQRDPNAGWNRSPESPSPGNTGAPPPQGPIPPEGNTGPGSPNAPVGYGGGLNPQALYGQIYSGLPPLPNTQIDVSQFSQPSPYEQALRDSIMAAIQEGQKPVNENDPTIAPILSSIRGQAQRASEQNQQLVGERLYGQGLPTSSGAWDTRVLGYNQQMNESTQNQVATTMVNQLNDRRNRLMTALNVGSNYLNSEQSRILQAELANVNNALTGYGMQQNVSLGILQSLLQNAQYYSGLGTQANEFGAQQNARAATGQ